VNVEERINKAELNSFFFL